MTHKKDNLETIYPIITKRSKRRENWGGGVFKLEMSNANEIGGLIKDKTSKVS
jgi:hypothetical protein